MVAPTGRLASRLAFRLPVTGCRSERPSRATAAANSPARTSASRCSAMLRGRSASIDQVRDVHRSYLPNTTLGRPLFPRCSRRRAPAVGRAGPRCPAGIPAAGAGKSRRGMSDRPAIMKAWSRESRRQRLPDRRRRPGQAVQVRLLGEFAITAGDRAAGPWPRPSARRLCALLLVSPGRRVTRDLACEELFPRLEPRAAARSLSKALSMARAALAELGEPGAALLGADLTHLWLSAGDRGRRRRPGGRAARRAGAAAGPGEGRRPGRRRSRRTASCSPTSRTPTGRTGPGTG